MIFNKNLLFAFLGWLLLIFFRGYTLGTDDQQELLPYILSIQQPTLYQHDFFISHLKEIIPNERYFFAHSLLPLLSHADPFFLIIHAITTIVLLLGMFRIGRMFLDDDITTWMVIYGSLILLYLHTLGGCELYYNTLQSSNIAKAIGIWAIYFFQQKRVYLSFFLLALITYIQLIVGLDTCMILCAVLLLKKEYKTLLYSGGLYALLTGYYLFSIMHARAATQAYDVEEYYQILFEFRHPHHFLMAHFGIKNIAAFFIADAAACYYFFKKNKDLFLFVIIVNIGIIIYYTAVEVLHFIPIANFNFYKMTIWVKYFGCVAAAAILLEFFPLKKLQEQANKYAIGCLVLIPVLFYGLILTNHLNLLKKPIMIGERIYQDPLIDISLKAKNSTNPQAVFITPFDATAFKYWSQRSSYIDFKANTRNPNNMSEWYNRIQLIYHVSMQDKIKGFDLKKQADHYFQDLNPTKISLYKKEGITHILLPKSRNNYSIFGQVVSENNEWQVLQIR